MVFIISWIVVFLSVVAPMYIMVNIQLAILKNDLSSMKSLLEGCIFLPFIVIVLLCVKNKLDIPLFVNLLGLVLASQLGKKNIEKGYFN
jgi:hypothetical protein